MIFYFIVIKKVYRNFIMQLNKEFKTYVNESISNLIVSLNKYKLTNFYRRIDLKFLNGFEKYINFGVMKHIYNKLSSLPESNDSICSIILVSNDNNYEIYMCNDKNDISFLINKNMKILKRSDNGMSIRNYIESKKKKIINNLYKKILDLSNDEQDILINKLLDNKSEKLPILDRNNNSTPISNSVTLIEQQTSNEPVSIINEDTFIIDRTSNNAVSSSDIISNESSTINLNTSNDYCKSNRSKRKKINESIDLNKNLKDLPILKRIRTGVKRYSDEFC